MTAPGATSPLRHNLLFFDVVRAVSAQLVVLGHGLNVGCPILFMAATNAGSLEARARVFYVQNLGVLVFFLISGYLITASAMRYPRNSIGFTEFIIRRAARIFTPLVPLLLILFLVERGAYGDQANLTFMIVRLDTVTLVLNLLLLFNNPIIGGIFHVVGSHARPDVLGTAQQLWTVGIEWWIYVAFAAIFFLWRQWNRPLAVIGFIFALAVPAYILAAKGGLIVAWLVGMTGCLLGERVRYKSGQLLFLCFSIILAIFSGVRLWMLQFDLYDPLFCLLFASALMILYVSFGDTKLNSPALIRKASDISYSLYLVHLSVLMAISRIFPLLVNSFWMVLLMMMSANLVAAAFYYAFERHYPKVTERLLWRYQRSRQRSADA